MTDPSPEDVNLGKITAWPQVIPHRGTKHRYCATIREGVDPAEFGRDGRIMVKAFLEGEPRYALYASGGRAP